MSPGESRNSGSENLNRSVADQEIDDAERKQAMLASIVETSTDAIISKSLQGIITSWNRGATNLFGYQEEEVIGKHISILIPSERLAEEDYIINSIRNARRVEHFDTIRVTKFGERIPISLSVSPIKDRQGKVIGASKIARNITERNKAEERQAILAAIVDTSDDAIISKTLEGIITSWNKSAERMFGYTESEAVGRHITLLIPEDRLAEEDLIIGSIVREQRIDHFETVRRTKSGELIPISLSVSPVKDSSGKIIGASKIARDIRVQQEAREASRRYTANLEAINALTQTISADLDMERIIQKVTDTTTQLTGAKFGAFFYNTKNESGESYLLYTLSGAPREAFDKLGMPRNTAIFHTTFSGEGITRVDDIRNHPKYGQNPPHYGMPHGHLPVVSYLSVPVVSKSGDVIGGLFFGHPEPGKFTYEHESAVQTIARQASIIIDNAKLYLEVKQLNEKKDEFIGLASHELKTPLSSLMGYLQILDRTSQNNANRKFLEKSIRQARKITSLVNDLLDISKIEAGKLQLTKERFDIREMVDEAIELIQNTQSSHRIVLNDDCPPHPDVFGDRQRIEQVLINLLTNAIKYSPSADKVLVDMKCSPAQLEISVTDFGIGIPNDKLSNIFSRFYRVEGLSPEMSGLGIGLYLSKEMIERHGGSLAVESTIGKGSTFKFTLPAPAH